jgi:hypothetical protein
LLVGSGFQPPAVLAHGPGAFLFGWKVCYVSDGLHGRWVDSSHGKLLFDGRPRHAPGFPDALFPVFDGTGRYEKKLAELLDGQPQVLPKRLDPTGQRGLSGSR